MSASEYGELCFSVSHPFSVVFVLAASFNVDTRERKEDMSFDSVTRGETLTGRSGKVYIPSICPRGGQQHLKTYAIVPRL